MKTIELVPDPGSDQVEVATITNNSERIVRMVVKMKHYITLEMASVYPGHYDWQHKDINVGVHELIEMGKIAQQLLVDIDEKEKS